MSVRRPFTVIGGFLGAGKTTLVNHILRESDGVRYAVLVNDFGAINIDRELIRSHDGRTLALANGCICCSLADGFVNTLLRLMREPEVFDHIVVEASGVAQPQRIMDIARLDPQLRADAVVVLADAETLPARLADDKIADVVADQLRTADLLVLNKTDRVDPAAQAAVTNTLRRYNLQAPILPCVDAALPLELLLGPRAGETHTPGAMAGDGHDHDHGHGHDHDHADARFETSSFSSEAALERARFEDFKTRLPQRVLRGKGLLRFGDAPERWWLWQRVGARDELDTYDGPAPPACRLVLIAGRDEKMRPGDRDELFDLFGRLQ